MEKINIIDNRYIKYYIIKWGPVFRACLGPLKFQDRPRHFRYTWVVVDHLQHLKNYEPIYWGWSVGSNHDILIFIYYCVLLLCQACKIS